MKNTFNKMGNFAIDLLFPRFCINCQKEGEWLCEDCMTLLDIKDVVNCPVCLARVEDFKVCSRCKNKTNLSGLLWAVSYQNTLAEKIIRQFKYEPFLRELSRSLAYIIISHLSLIEANKNNFLQNFVLVPIPLHKKRLKWRGFNQAEEIAKHIGSHFNIPILNNVLIRQKETKNQAELDKEERKENITKVFAVKNPELIFGKKIFLVDDVYTTGSTIQEATKTLKQAGAKEIWGMVVARGK
jgi:ComF family protein